MPKAPAVQAVINGWMLSWGNPQRRSALYALVKTTVLIGALWEYVWLWHTKFYSRQYPEVALSIALNKTWCARATHIPTARRSARGF